MQGAAKENCRSFAGLEAALKNVGAEKSADIMDNIVSISSCNGDTDTGKSGSGVLLTRDGFILTAFHVIDPHKDLLYGLARYDKLPEGKEYDLQGIASRCTKVCLNGEAYDLDLSFVLGSEVVDFALVKAMLPGDPVPTGVRFAQEPPRFGEFVSANGAFGRRFEGTVLGMKFRESLPLYVLTTAMAQHGMSGSQFLNGQGEYFGMVIRGSPTPFGGFSDLSLGLTVQYLQSMLVPAAALCKERWQRKANQGLTKVSLSAP